MGYRAGALYGEQRDPVRRIGSVDRIEHVDLETAADTADLAEGGGNAEGIGTLYWNKHRR